MGLITYEPFKTIADLKQLIAETESEIERRKAADRERLLAQAKETASRYGMTVEAFFERAVSKDRSRSKPTYYNPNQPDETWGGRGKPPHWFQAALSNGMTKEQLRIRQQE